MLSPLGSILRQHTLDLALHGVQQSDAHGQLLLVKPFFPIVMTRIGKSQGVRCITAEFYV